MELHKDEKLVESESSRKRVQRSLSLSSLSDMINNKTGNKDPMDSCECSPKSGSRKSLNRGYIIVDCRFDYEYRGGHISGAINISDPQELDELMLRHMDLLLYKKVAKTLRI